MKAHWNGDSQCWDSPQFVYIGRANRTYHLPQSQWDNPFWEGKDGTRAQVIERYREWLLDQPHLLAELGTLRGKTLVCWCKPKSCHGDVLAAMLGDFVPAPRQLDLFDQT